MKIFSQRIDGTLHIYLQGDLDHHAARSAIPEISRLIEIEQPIKLVIDFDNISFMDSSGIALVIGAFKRCHAIGCEFELLNVSKQAYKVFNAAGVCKLININPKQTPILSK